MGVLTERRGRASVMAHRAPIGRTYWHTSAKLCIYLPLGPALRLT